MVDRLIEQERLQREKEFAHLEEEALDAAALEVIAEDARTCARYSGAVQRLQSRGIQHLNDETLTALEKKVKVWTKQEEQEKVTKEVKQQKRMNVAKNIIGGVLLATGLLGAVSRIPIVRQLYDTTYRTQYETKKVFTEKMITEYGRIYGGCQKKRSKIYLGNFLHLFERTTTRPKGRR